MLARYEYNLETHERSEIFQRVYKNADGEVIVIDDCETAPDGFKEMDDFN